MRRIGLVVTDLDGTILRPDGSFSDATRRAFQHLRAAGIPAAIALTVSNAAQAAAVNKVFPLI